MSLIETLRVAWEALAANKLRSALTMLGIIIGVGSVIAIIAIGRGTGAAVQGELQGIASGQFVLFAGQPGPGRATDRTEPFAEADLRNIRDLLPDVEGVATTFSMGGMVKYGRESFTTQVQGHYANVSDLFGIKIAQGRWFSKAEEEGGSRVVVLGYGAVIELMGEGAPAVGRSISVNGHPFQIIGVTEKVTGVLASSLGVQDTSLYVPITWVRRIQGNPPIMQVVVKVKTGASTDAVMKDALALVERNHKGASFSGQSLDQFLGIIDTVIAIVTGVLSAVAGISLVVGGVGIMNIMLVSVTERTREIGIRKAIGASYRDILTQFLIESVLLSLIGGSIGVALAAVPVWLVGRMLEIPLLLDWQAIALATSFSVTVGILFGVYPASKAAKLDPIEALRYD